jgi:3-oxoacyl-[acyl-carrier-protein] synthase-3
MRAVGVESIAISLPPQRRAVAEIVDASDLDTHDRGVVAAFGIDTVAASHQSSHELAMAAARAALADAGATPDQLDVILHISSRVPERLMCSEATRVQAELGATRAIAINTGDLGCASSSAALLIAKSLLEANHGWARVLIVHGSITPTPGRVRLPVTVNGDAGMAILISARDFRLALAAVVMRTTGKYWDLFYVDYLERPRQQWREHCTDPARYSFELAMDSRRAAGALADELRAAGADLDTADYLVTQNLSLAAFEFYEQILGQPVAGSCRAHLRHLGHLGAVDVFANTEALLPAAAPGERIALLNSSPAAAWSACLLEVR